MYVDSSRPVREAIPVAIPVFVRKIQPTLEEEHDVAHLPGEESPPKRHPKRIVRSVAWLGLSPEASKIRTTKESE